MTAFVVDRSKEREASYTEVLMSGNGQYGGLGNNVFTTSQSNASRVKAISGLKQCALSHSLVTYEASPDHVAVNDRTNTLEAIKPAEITVSPSGHVLLAMQSSADSNGVGGDDVMVWGRNFDYELGNGKKSNLPTPVHLDIAEGERLMLMERRAAEVKDLHGKVWKKGVKVRQQVAAGYGTSAVYWKIEQ